jgi:hypothetical protein
MRRVTRGAWAVVGAAAVGLLAAATLGVPSAAAGPTVSTVAGTGRLGASGDGGPSVQARLAAPSAVAVDAAGDVAVADTGNCEIRFIAARRGRHFGQAMLAAHIYTVAGHGCHGRGAATRGPRLEDPTAVAFDPAGDLLIADGSADRIDELPLSTGRDYAVAVTAGRLTTVAGTGATGPSTSGRAARSSPLDDPQGIAVDGAGDLFIADTAACRVVEVPDAAVTRDGDALDAGRLYVVAGTGVCGYGGDGGPAAAAQLWSPSAVTVDGAGDLIIADEGNSAIREVAATTGTFLGVPLAAGDIGTVAGQDTAGVYLTDGLAATGAASAINYPAGVAVDSAGDLFIADSADQCLREVPARSGVLFGRNVVADKMYTLAGVLTTSAGVPAGDGTAWITTHVDDPSGVALGPGGSLYFTDAGADTVRRIAGP